MRRSAMKPRPIEVTLSQEPSTPPTDDVPPDEPKPDASKPRHHLAIGALIVPLLGACAILWAETTAQGFAISAVTVILSSLLVYLDARQLSDCAANGKKQTAPLVMLLASLILWIAFYPWSFVRRSRITGPNLSLVAVLVAAIFAGGPTLYYYLMPPGLPRCDSTEVKQVIQQLVRQSPEVGNIIKIDGHQQLSYDASKQQRIGQCMLHTRQGKELLKYIVEWRDQENAHFQVRTIIELPTCSSPEAKQLLEQVIRESELGQGLQSIGDHQELSYDAQKEERVGVCTLNTAKGKVKIKYLINWQDKNKGMFQVQVMPIDLKG
jgi:hypothetical protein